MSGEFRELYPGGWRQRQEHGDGIASLHYPDGSIRVAHACKSVEGVQLWLAPSLEDHTIESREPLSVSPSILCPDCGLHGFITGGRWTDV